MNLDDRLTIDTPEGVSIDLTLAGLGSRMGAAIIDILIQGAALVAVVLAMTLAGASLDPELGVFLVGVGTLVISVVVLGYYLLFEALNGGRTPGKAAFGLRVAMMDGTPVSLGAIAIRTLLRVIDFLPGLYALGALTIMLTGKNQRIGDLAAATVVVRDRTETQSQPAVPDRFPAGWDVTGVTDAELTLVRRFTGRRFDLAEDARRNLAADLAGRLRGKVNGGRDLDDEEFLLQLLVEKDSRRD